MSDILRGAALTAATLALTFAAAAASGQGLNKVSSKPSPDQSAKKPSITTRCIAPGTSRPVACAMAQAGSDVELLVHGPLSGAPPVLFIRQVGGAGHPARLQPKWFLDQGTVKARLPASEQLCPANAKGQQLQFEIQMATSDLQSRDTGGADSVGWFQMRC